MEADDERGPPSAEDAPKMRRAYSTYGGVVETEGSAAEAEILRGFWDVDDADARALTHGFHAYAGRLHPTTAKRAVAAFSAPGATVFDPFCGGGSVLVEAYAAGRAAVGSDVSGLAARLARVRTDVMSPVERLRLVEDARRISDRAASMARERSKPHVPRGAGEEFERFEPHVTYELFAIRERLFGFDGPADAVVRALRLCFSSILVKCLKRDAPLSAKAQSEGAQPVPRRVGRGMPSKWFAARAEELARGLEALAAAAPEGTPAPRVEECDARLLEPFADATHDLVVSSPPYAGIYDYEEEHGIRFAWLGLPRDRFHKDQWGARDPAMDGANPGAWLEGRRRWIGELSRTMKPRGKVVLVVGDGVVGVRPEDAAGATTAAAREFGLRWVARASQPRPPRSTIVAELFRGTQRREHVLLYEKA